MPGWKALNFKQMEQFQWILEVRKERLGPYTTQSIVQRLMRGEVRVIHRVSETGEGWVAICNEPIFEQYISQLIEHMAEQVARGSIAKVEEQDTGAVDDDATVVSKDIDDLSGVFNLNDLKQGISQQLNHAKELQQAATNLAILRKLLSEIRIKRKVVIVTDDKPPSEEDEVHPDDKDVYILTKKNFSDYVSSGSAKFMTSILVLAIFAFLGVKWKEKRDRDEELALQKAQQESLIKSKYSGKLGNENEVMIMSTADLLEKANSMLGQQKLTRWTLVDSAKNGGVSSQEQRPENYKEHRDVFLALNKKAYEFLLGGELEKAEEFLLKSLALFSERKHIAILLLTETALLFNQADSSSLSKIRLQQVAEIIRKYRSKDEKTSTKLLVAEMVLYHELGESEKLKNVVNRFLKAHPRGEREENTVGYLQKVSWTGLLPHCIKVYSSDNANSLFSAMLAGCLARTPSVKKSEPYIYYAYKKNPGNEVMKDLLAWVYFDTGQYDKAKKLMWDPSIPSFQVSSYLTFSRIEFCRIRGNDPICSGRSTASDK